MVPTATPLHRENHLTPTPPKQQNHQTTKQQNMIDTHCHLDDEQYKEDLDEVLERAKDAGIEKIFVPGICLKDMPHLIYICKENPNYLYPMVGLHPENIMDEDYHNALDQMEKMIDDSTIAIGEVGLDLYWDDTYEKEQIEVLEHQIEWAKKYNLPLMMHVRKAHNQLIKIMRSHKDDNLSGVFHCFSGSAEQARELLAFPGFMLGIGGVLTFKKSKLPEVLKQEVPLDRIVLETDGPYLAPTPYRGKRNESCYVREVAKMLSDIYDVTIEEIDAITTKNALKIFKKCH